MRRRRSKLRMIFRLRTTVMTKQGQSMMPLRAERLSQRSQLARKARRKMLEMSQVR
jgi:hypothetical protein